MTQVKFVVLLLKGAVPALISLLTLVSLLAGIKDSRNYQITVLDKFWLLRVEFGYLLGMFGLLSEWPSITGYLNLPQRVTQICPRPEVRAYPNVP